MSAKTEPIQLGIRKVNGLRVTREQIDMMVRLEDGKPVLLHRNTMRRLQQRFPFFRDERVVRRVWSGQNQLDALRIAEEFPGVFPTENGHLRLKRVENYAVYEAGPEFRTVTVL